MTPFDGGREWVRALNKTKETMLKLNPMDDRLIVEPDPEDGDQILGSGIILPGVTAEEKQIGTVVAVGPGRMNDDGKRIPMALKEGDRVMYGKFAGTELVLDRREILVLREADVIVTVEGE